jgi:hypothetical protein
MTTIAAVEKTDFFEALVAGGLSPEIPEEFNLYGRLIGSWVLDVIHYRVNVASRNLEGEAHFAWVLEGRAVQDTWIMPRRSDRTAEIDRTCNMYGTTFRVWDPAIQAWRVTWTNPVTGMRDELVARWSGKDIVQIGTHSDGTPIRWIFTDITPDSFRWIGEALNPDGKTWRLEGEFRGRRMRK